jgi:hypothetical protein
MKDIDKTKTIKFEEENQNLIRKAIKVYYSDGCVLVYY